MGTVIPSRLWRQMWRFLDDLYQADGDEDSLAILFEGIERLIAYDAAVYIPLDPTRRAPSATGAKGQNLEGFERHAFDYEHYYWRLDPLAAFFAPSFSNQPVRYSDAVADRRAFLNSEFFVDFVSTMSVRHGIGCQLATGDRPVGGLALHRQGRRDFSAREKEIYRLLAPHLARVLGRGAEPVAAVAVGAAADAVLTRREREIAALAAAGLRNREIAQRCFITEQTVKDHLRSVFEKLGVRNRTELAVRSGRPIGGDLE